MNNFNSVLRTVVALFACITLFSNCSKDEIALQLISNNEHVFRDFTSLEINADVSVLGKRVEQRGLCYSYNENPTIEDDITIATTNVFTSKIEGLSHDMRYYVRAYAITKSGDVYYSESKRFETFSMDHTRWTFEIIHGPDKQWHGDVLFRHNGTAVYTEPNQSNDISIEGTWRIEGSTLYYDMDRYDYKNESFQFEGVLKDDQIEGTYTFGPQIKFFKARKQ